MTCQWHEDGWCLGKLIYILKDLGPSNGRVKEPVLRRGRVLKIASFEGPMILRDKQKKLCFRSISLAAALMSHTSIRFTDRN